MSEPIIPTQPGRYDLAKVIAFERLNPTGEYDGAPERVDFAIADAVLALITKESSNV